MPQQALENPRNKVVATIKRFYSAHGGVEIRRSLSEFQHRQL
jgi:hypothetical protein